MKVSLALLLFGSMLVGCESWSDYPHNEPCATKTDQHPSGPGSYGGTEAPTNNNTPTTPTPTTTPTQ